MSDVKKQNKKSLLSTVKPSKAGAMLIFQMESSTPSKTSNV